MKKNGWIVLLLLVAMQLQAQKFEGLALTPPMGWNSWNTFQTNINEQLAKETADLFITSGMKDAGYLYIVLDDGWMAKERDSITGDLIPDPKKFPHGMKAVVDYVHSKGLKFGLYNCAGTKTCAGYPGTRGYEYQDARFYASLGIDYLKFDWCNSEGLSAKEAYTTMSNALRKAGRPIIFSLCEWGDNKPWLWAKETGQLWRTTGDIANIFDGIKNYGTWHANGVMTIVDMQDTLRKYAGPGHWNDPDMLEVGNGMKVNEDRAHFSIWCMLAAPLMAGNDLRKMTKEAKETLTDKDIIAIDQDPAGMQALKYAEKDSVQTWLKPLKNGDWAVCFLNRSLSSKDLSIDWKQMTVADNLSGTELNAVKNNYRVRDIWLKQNRGTTANPFKTTVPAHDVIVLRLAK
ncbi:MAG: glycoside hydrolase family 27 protein [Bacteroidota bacterium]|nr:glycoside hydrolase family 27 protein [Bacteroidota bacterium]